MEHRIITKKGILQEGWSYNNKEELFGSAQGTRWSPTNWGGIADVIAVAIMLYLYSMKFKSLTFIFSSERTNDTYLDNTNTGITGKRVKENETVKNI